MHHQERTRVVRRQDSTALLCAARDGERQPPGVCVPAHLLVQWRAPLSFRFPADAREPVAHAHSQQQMYCERARQRSHPR